jgi:hypothetical protein
MPERQPLAVWPRGMPLEMAALYCGVGTHILTQNGPQPIRIGRKRKVWLKDQLDSWLDRLAGKTPTSPENDEWAG